MKWLRFQRSISLETQGGITSQRKKWVNVHHRMYPRWDQMPRRIDLSLLRIVDDAEIEIIPFVTNLSH
jgi:hypothetical protein